MNLLVITVGPASYFPKIFLIGTYKPLESTFISFPAVGMPRFLTLISLSSIFTFILLFLLSCVVCGPYLHHIILHSSS